MLRRSGSRLHFQVSYVLFGTFLASVLGNTSYHLANAPDTCPSVANGSQTVRRSKSLRLKCSAEHIKGPDTTYVAYYRTS